MLTDLLLGLLALSPSADAKVDFVRDVQPLLARHCLECHDHNRQRGKLRLDVRDHAQKRGVLRADNNELLRRVALPKDDAERMPPRGEPLSPGEVAVLRNWIAQGASWPDGVTARRHWAYTPPATPPLPNVRDTAWPRHPVDRFVLARLEREKLTPSPQAAPHVLLRRVYLDLVGFPPSPQEADDYLNDPRPDAYERLVDRLLASPRFGERWARHWLDLARYADSHGFQRDDLRELWPYRDWVIRAVNDDVPFDRFTIEQLAGDLLPDATRDQKIATGFHRGAPTNVEAGSDPEETRVNQIHDRVSTTAAVWLGTTLECAQCHDHKYDPFTMKDYYGLFAFFNSTTKEAERSNPKVPGSIKFLGPRLAVPGPRNQMATSLVMQELPAPRISRIFVRGDFRTPGDVVLPQTPEVLSAPGRRATRLDLARWLVSTENPLVARVQVNRVWAEVFGQGLVRTMEDFGVKGEPPTHPELLDWLAREYVDNGMSLKKLVRLLVTSDTYRQASRLTPLLRERDEDNRLLARAPRLRLDAEAIRDNALAAAGLLYHELGGPPVRPYQPLGLWKKVGGDPVEYVVSPKPDRYRRGIYVVWKRASPYPSFVTFGASERLACVVKRSRAETPLQALTLLNDPVYVETAEALASRVQRELPAAALDDQLRYAFRLCLVRPPSPRELDVLRRLYHEGGDAWYNVATVLLNLDEMITKG